nr:uncharacterized protein LOC131276694 [Dasypus novemcinctus]
MWQKRWLCRGEPRKDLGDALAGPAPEGGDFRGFQATPAALSTVLKARSPRVLRPGSLRSPSISITASATALEARKAFSSAAGAAGPPLRPPPRSSRLGDGKTSRPPSAIPPGSRASARPRAVTSPPSPPIPSRSSHSDLRALLRDLPASGPSFLRLPLTDMLGLQALLARPSLLPDFITVLGCAAEMNLKSSSDKASTY